VGDGKVFWMYTPSENRVDKMPLRDTDDLQAPIAFLLGKLHFDKEFRNLQGKPEGSDTRITGEPKTDSLPYSAVEFLVTPEGRIREVKVTRFDNAIMGYTFDQEKMNPKLDDKLFQFQVPKGAEVVEAGKN
jgi:outer membrane lipoprotein carrier protein